MLYQRIMTFYNQYIITTHNNYYYRYRLTLYLPICISNKIHMFRYV